MVYVLLILCGVLTGLNKGAFCNCDNLENVYFYSYELPTLGLSAFENTDFTLYVPQSKRNEYVSAFMGYTNDIVP